MDFLNNFLHRKICNGVKDTTTMLIFIQNLFNWAGGWDKDWKWSLFEHELPPGFILYNTVQAKWPTLVLDYV